MAVFALDYSKLYCTISDMSNNPYYERWSSFMSGSRSIHYETHPTDTVITEYQVGMRFEPLDSDSTLKDKFATSESFIKKRHWSLVFIPAPSASSIAKRAFRLDLSNCSIDGVSFYASVVPENHPMHCIGSWTGCFQDIKELMWTHPIMHRSSTIEYSASFSNCQHWAATMLVLLVAQAGKRRGRYFIVENHKRYKTVLSVLSKSGDSLYNKPNPLFKGMTGGPLSIGLAGAAGLGALATATVPVTVTITLPAAGLAAVLSAAGTETVVLGSAATAMGPMTAGAALPAVSLTGFFSVTGTEMAIVGSVATAGATVCAVVLPFILVPAIVGGIWLGLEVSEWKGKTKFKNPQSGITSFGETAFERRWMEMINSA